MRSQVYNSPLQSGRTAFASPSEIYIIGYHPGGDPKQFPHQIGNRLDRVRNHKDAEDWSSYLDDRWDGKPEGSTPMQKRMKHLFHGQRLGLDLHTVPASHLIFRCWDAANEPAAAVKREWAEECWPFHQAVINRLDVKIVVCLGSYARYWVLKDEREKTGVELEPFDVFEENSRRAWRSYAYQARDRYIVSLTHPVWANWKNRDLDPTPLVERVLAKIRG